MERHGIVEFFKCHFQNLTDYKPNYIYLFEVVAEGSKGKTSQPQQIKTKLWRQHVVSGLVVDGRCLVSPASCCVLQTAWYHFTFQGLIITMPDEVNNPEPYKHTPHL